MLTWNDVMYARERRQQDIRIAEKERLIRHVVGYRPLLVRCCRFGLARLGTQLVALGSQLQARGDLQHVSGPYAD